MKNMWLNLLKTISIAFFFFLVSCKKEKSYTQMKIGYYNITDIRIYDNSTVDTFHYIGLGPRSWGKGNAIISFTSDSSGNLISNSFKFSYASSSNSSNSGVTEYYTIVDYSLTETLLEVHRTPNFTTNFTNKITFKYIQ
jgi:hypothetical protein